MAGEGTPKAVFPTLVGRPRHMVCSVPPLPVVDYLTHWRLSITDMHAHILNYVLKFRGT